MRLRYYIILSIVALVITGCTDNEVKTPDEVTEWMDNYLKDNYLYNEDYKALNRDLTLSWDEYLDITLPKLGANLDYKNNHLYSFINRSAASKAVTRISDNKVLEWSFGAASIVIVELPSSLYGIAILAVYKDSPMYNAGIRRGDIITKVNGSAISSYNMAYYYATSLAYPSSATSYSVTINYQTTSNITASNMYCSPILKYDYFGDNNKVGYLSYFSFDAAYDSELLAVMADFKSAGVTDVILDMRLNGGGYVNSANKLSSAIAGIAGLGKTFTYFEYNPSRGSSYSNFITLSAAQRIDLERVYCLVSSYTASASELVINSLRGIDIEVILIGETTNGKNVGMEVPNADNDSTDEWEYYFAPITFKLSNAKGFGDYEYGFGVNSGAEISDWGAGGENFSDFDEDEVLIQAALNHISTGSFTSPTAMTRTTSTGVAIDKGQTLFAPSRMSGNIVIDD